MCLCATLYYIWHMKLLLAMRHAKSSWDEPNLDDFDRPLNSRGERDAPKMGKRIAKKGIHVDHICSSPANRAISTAKLMAEAIDYPLKKIQKEQALYHAGEDSILKIISSLPDTAERVLLVGHNPGLTDFVNNFPGTSIENIPTAGLVVIEFDIKEWKSATWKNGKVVHVDSPKK